MWERRESGSDTRVGLLQGSLRVAADDDTELGQGRRQAVADAALVVTVPRLEMQGPTGLRVSLPAAHALAGVVGARPLADLGEGCTSRGVAACGVDEDGRVWRRDFVVIG